MRKYALLLMLIITTCATTVYAAENKETCLTCHEKMTPGVVRVWSSSAHAEQGVACDDCHGSEYGRDHGEGGKRIVVEAYICARCHSEAAKEHFTGKHGIGFRAGHACTRNLRPTPEIREGCSDCHEKGSALPRQDAECARFLAQTPEMQRQGCLSCHKIEVRCDACHTSHDTDLAIVRDPAVCGTCHMGPDHPQYEMWKTSRHGVLFDLKGRGYSPDCMTCHMPEGTHNVSTGISMGLFGQKYPKDVRAAEREKMMEICSRCHSKSFATVNLDDGDAIQKQSRALVDEAASIIRGLEEEGLLMPSPADRPEHPLVGQKLELGPQMIYEDLSGVEAIFFRMKKYYYVITYKGVFHQNPDYAHWYGNAPLKLALSEIRSEAMKLREIKRLKDRLDNLSEIRLQGLSPSGNNEESLKMDIRILLEEHLKGDMSEDEYEMRRKELLDKLGL